MAYLDDESARRRREAFAFAVVVLVFVGLFSMIFLGCAKAAPNVPTPTAARAWPRAPIDFSAILGPFPPRPVQPLPVDTPQFWYNVLELDEIATRFVLTPASIAIEDRQGRWITYPLLIDLSVAGDTSLCLPPPPRVNPLPPGATPWDGELCQTTDALRAWLTGGPADKFVGDLPPGPPQPIGGPFGDLQFVGAPGPDWIHIDADEGQFGGGGQCCTYHGAMQFEPFSKRIVMTIATLESGNISEYGEVELGWRIHGDVDPNALVCLETYGAAGPSHQERCTTIGRVREWLLRYGKAIPPVMPVQPLPLPPEPTTPPPPITGTPRK